MELVSSKPKTIRILSLLVVYVFAIASGINTTRVSTQQGFVNGIREDIQTAQGQTKNIYKFLGVPYAQKPINNLRFKPPQSLSNRSSSADYNATSFAPICMQIRHYFDSIRGVWPEFDPKKDMSEDCLYLNIYTPSTNSTRRHPVIVHIHGGSYRVGTPTRDISPGEYLPTRDVVLVTIQYRLGAFGFFTTGDSEAPGNLGLLDQIEALKWIQQNIESFGGDKNSVTLLGESAGGFSVGLHYLSPLSRGLFHRGIAVSGVDVCHFATKPKSKVYQASKHLLQRINCVRNSSRLNVECLQSISSIDVLRNADTTVIQPFVDQHFLPDDPKILRKQGKFHKLPLMSGFGSKEGSYILDLVGNVTNDGEFRSFLHSWLWYVFGHNVNQSCTAFQAIVSQYTSSINTSSEYNNNFAEMLTDFYFAAPAHAALSFHSKNGTASYLFEFTHRSKYHPKLEWMGVVHEDTTAYKFGLPLLRSNRSKLRFDDIDRNISDIVVTMFTNFAKFGNPTPTPVYGVQWKPFNSSDKAYLKIQSNPLMMFNYHPQRMSFWNNDFPTLFQDCTDLPSRRIGFNLFNYIL